ncbi:hypothetical protein ABW19_dt0204332 [Dactylella cylindrospora]|nr:hypothetical protein ABW19_dt0204332 [Dactylella cylindrospora]
MILNQLSMISPHYPIDGKSPRATPSGIALSILGEPLIAKKNQGWILEEDVKCLSLIDYSQMTFFFPLVQFCEMCRWIYLALPPRLFLRSLPTRLLKRRKSFFYLGFWFLSGSIDQTTDSCCFVQPPAIVQHSLLFENSGCLHILLHGW